jgi:hypothetical protein
MPVYNTRQPRFEECSGETSTSKSRCGWAWALLFSVGAAWSCGGKTVSDDGTAGASGAGAAGVSGTSGAGASGRGGAGKGGSSTGGRGGSATGGSGGALPSRCRLPADSGPCEAAFRKYYHDARTGVCVPFIYGGCGGNDNRFDTIAECQAACRGGTPDMDRCDKSVDCQLIAPECCRACEPATWESFASINRRYAADYEKVNACDRVDCAACPEVDELRRTSQYFIAGCNAGHCAVIDIRLSGYTECRANSDCSLRVGANCCEGCAAQGLVAISRRAEFTEFVCGNEPVGCPACAPQIPARFAATCSAGRCQVTSR